MSSITLGLFLFRTRNIFLDGLIIRNEGTDTKNFILQERVKCSTEKAGNFPIENARFPTNNKKVIHSRFHLPQQS